MGSHPQRMKALIKLSLYHLCSSIPSYALPVTAGYRLPYDLPRLSVHNSGVIFDFILLISGFHHPGLSGKLPIKLLSPSSFLALLIILYIFSTVNSSISIP